MHAAGKTNRAVLLSPSLTSSEYVCRVLSVSLSLLLLSQSLDCVHATGIFHFISFSLLSPSVLRVPPPSLCLSLVSLLCDMRDKKRNQPGGEWLEDNRIGSLPCCF